MGASLTLTQTLASAFDILRTRTGSGDSGWVNLFLLLQGKARGWWWGRAGPRTAINGIPWPHIPWVVGEARPFCLTLPQGEMERMGGTQK